MVSRNLPFAPLQPSNLKIASGPDSPASPLSPFGLRPRPLSSSRERPISPLDYSTPSSALGTNAPPVKPDAWTWKCHQCRSRFPLGATRRCLHDGHYLCSGTREVSRRSGRLKNSKSCSSEFDYAGWRAYSKWMKQISRKKLRDRGETTDQCIFPSECRWSPESRAERLREDCAVSEPGDVGPTPTFDSILGLSQSGIPVEYPEPTVSFTLRYGHLNPLSSAPTPRAILTPSELEGSQPEPIISKNDTEPKTDAVQPASGRRRSAHPTLQKLEKLTARRSAKLPISLSPIEEERSQSKKLNNVTHCKINQPILHFSAYPDKFPESSHERVKPPTWSTNESSEKNCLRPLALEDAYMEGDWLDGPLQTMADSDGGCGKFLLAGENIESNHQKSFSELDEASGNALFDFNLQQDDDPVISPRRNAWDWTPGDPQIRDIGIALSSPLSMDDEGRWLDEMDMT